MDLNDSGFDPNEIQDDFIKEYSRGTTHLPREFGLAGSSVITAQSLDYQPNEQEREEEERQLRAWASTKTIPSTTRGSDGNQLYKSLVDPYEIRVLELEPGAAEDPLRGSLHHCSLEFEFRFQIDESTSYQKRQAVSMKDFTKPFQYSALSYTWGPPIFEAAVECEGHTKKITKTLEAALRHFRQTDKSVFMWIDQICINQDDTKEKEQQIPLMSRIYRHAINTVIWLGEASAGSGSAIQFLKDINYLLQFTGSEIAPADFERIGLPAPESQTWKEVWDLFCRPWFTRVWIIQEAILSWDLWVACGDAYTPWDTFANGITHLTTAGISRWLQQTHGPKPIEAGDNKDVCRSAEGLSEMRSQYYSFNHHPDLFDLLVQTWSAQCYDNRDKIYGLLGVCEDSDRAAVRMSYADDWTAAELYHDMAIHHLQKDQSGWRLATVLSCVDHDSSELPSWVPEWRQPRQTTSLGLSTASRGFYRACGRFVPVRGRIPFTISKTDKHELSMRGIPVDTLAECSEVLANIDLSYHEPAVENKTLLACMEFASRLQQHPGGDTVFTAFWKTMIADKDGTGKLEAPSSYAEIFSLLLDESTGKSPSLPGQTYSARQKRPKGKGRLEVSQLDRRAPGQIFQEIRVAMKAALQNRRLGISKNGNFGLFPRQSKTGDVVCVVDSCHMPFLLRRIENGKFRLVGECYVHGIMKGEAVGENVVMEDLVLR